ncbi:MAG: DinB family protein [Dehalococcoidia bacterium]
MTSHVSMEATINKRPEPAEYDPYYQGYIDLAEANPLTQLERQIRSFELAGRLSQELAAGRPAQEEWSVNEVLVHLCDFERNFVYRALRFSRGNLEPIAGFDQDAFIATAGANQRNLTDIVDELVSLRRSTIRFFASLSAAQLRQAGVAGGAAITVRALLFIVPGHCEGHLNDLRRLHPEIFPAV